MVLIVDDDEDELKFIERVLRGWKVIVKTCDNPEAALDLIATNHFDVVLVDQAMPRISGLELLKKMKPKSRATRFYVLSGSVKMSFINEAEQLGFHFISKDHMRGAFDLIFEQK